MDNRNNSRFSPPAVGGVSLLVVFAVLCLTIFALLSLTTVQADVRLADATAQAVADYYAADCQAQEILARLRRGERPEGVAFYGSDGSYAQYACPISETQQLQALVYIGGDGSWNVLRWQAMPSQEWEASEELELWDGVVY